MTNRVLLGARPNGETGLFISKPGNNALVVGEDLMLLSVARRAFQVIDVRTFVYGSSGLTMTMPNQGFYPLIIIQSEKFYMGYSVQSYTRFTLIDMGPKTLDPSVDFNAYCYITNQDMQLG